MEGFERGEVMTQRERIGRIEVDVEGAFYDLKGREMIYKLHFAMSTRDMMSKAKGTRQTIQVVICNDGKG